MFKREDHRGLAAHGMSHHRHGLIKVGDDLGQVLRHVKIAMAVKPRAVTMIAQINRYYPPVTG